MPGIAPDVISHKLTISSAYKPVRQKRRSYDAERYEAMRTEVEKLQTIGFIREATYPVWLANSVMVRKSTGGWRMCQDYTDLNKACPKDSFPLPRIDQLVDATAGHELLSFMDAYSGYNQIFMHPPDSEHTAFITDKGLYCYNVMPFGLKNAGATYQRLVNKIFAGYIGNIMEVYVDDMLVKSRTAEDHLQNLSIMFGILKEYRMRLNPKKCAFGVSSGKFLGFMISQRGIEANPEKIKAIIDMERPKTTKDIQSLTGRVAALTRFISKATDKCVPFFKALKGGKRDITWTAECDNAFQALKNYMSKAPLLSKPLPGEILYLYLSVSGTAVSSVLIRKPEKAELPIFYVSKALQSAELRYPPLEQLALALVVSARRLRPYFQAHGIKVLTNQPLRQVLQKPEISGRLIKWAIELGEFDIQFVPRPAEKGQAVADFISELTPATVQPASEAITETILPYQTGAKCLDTSTPVWCLHVDGSANQQGCGAGLQNGVAERKNRHIIETTITLLATAALNDKFWYYAAAHAAFLINRMPCQLLQMTSPYFKLFGHNPELQSLKVFGSAVYPLLRPYNSHKLEPRSAEHVFLGYSLGYKGVICFHPNTHKVVISRHVIYDETQFPMKNYSVSSTQSSSVMTQLSPSAIAVSLPYRYVTTTESDHSPLPCSNENSSSSVSTSEAQEVLGSAQTMQPILDPAQLQVLLPLSVTDASNSSSHISIPQHGHSMQTRLKSGISKKKDFGDFQCFSTCLSTITALDEPHTFREASTKSEWQQAMIEEIQALQTQGTWDLVPPPSDKNIVGCRWIYKIKRHADGRIARYKARLVAQGFSQEQGIDFDETFSPVVRHTTVRLILSLAASHRWCLRQLDVKNAFLHGDLQEEVYMKQPLGFIDDHYPDYVCRLRKSLYGLKQAPRAWNAKFTRYLPALGFVSSHSDPSLFVKHDGPNVVILLLYVDDIIITGSSSTLVQSVIDDLGQVFDMKDIGQLTYFLGLEVSYQSNGDLFVNQAKYARDLLKRAGMETCKPSITPCKPHCRVLTTDGTLLPDPTMFRSLVGALQYLTFTRPDLAYAVNTILQDLHIVLPEAPVLHSDNLSALALSSNPVLHSRIKHLELDFHFIREWVQRHDLVVRYVNTEDQVADIFTKGLHSPLFLKHCHNLSVGPATTAIEGG
ncbi:hypothetical protein L3X38_031430 [Prunus dulcis]|uniref:Reverse transcriptase domain-containing protein n=2 Tax=Prunus dulcis TaxID=3755 RepID=A0AAD4YVM1_PRUDU|nr:hypothetical protein L3X38_031430 [Prunus dulcis]